MDKCLVEKMTKIILDKNHFFNETSALFHIEVADHKIVGVPEN